MSTSLRPTSNFEPRENVGNVNNGNFSYFFVNFLFLLGAPAAPQPVSTSMFDSKEKSGEIIAGW